MTRGKSICNVLKTIRTQIAKANEIKYEPRECHHEGECRGTCPACEAEVRYIERQLDIRRQLGKAVTILGISAGLSALTGCGNKAKKMESHSPVDIMIVDKDSGSAIQFQTPDPQQDEEVYEIMGRTGGVDVESIPNPYPIIESSSEKIYDVVEQMPSFTGGSEKLYEYLVENVRYPKEMADSSVQGRVIVKFVVEKDGSITDTKVVKSVHPTLDQEALRVISAMPKWIPGSQNGVRVRVKYTLPVTFRLK